MRFYKLFTLLLLCCLGFNSQAQEITISGQVYFVTFDIPIPDVPVTLNYTDPVGNVLVQETMTDSSGMYSFTFENEISPTNPFGVAIVSTFDFCTGQEVTLGFDVGPENTNFENADFNLCAEVDPPDPNENCAAFFEAYPTPGEPNGFTFVDLSYSEQPITSWFWDFGDGTTSTEQNPEHVFAFEGGFDILLTITTDSCTSTTIGTVFAPHSDGCECPDIFQPVCVEVEGDTLSFSNICEAVCEGYEVDEVFECTITNNPCGCDDIYNPVCVYSDSGEFFFFVNPCEAACAGWEDVFFTDCDFDQECNAQFYINQPDFSSLTVTFNDLSATTVGFIESWAWDFGDGNTSMESNPTHTYAEGGIYDVTLTITTSNGCVSTTIQHICIGDVNDCDCPAEYDPVCVDLFGLVLTFPNLCEAECAGFGADQVVDCQLGGDDCDCPDVFDPVCVATAAGTQLFLNTCFAECEGFTVGDFTDCDDLGCVCPEYYDPVCVLSPEGDTLTFDNPCFANCEGYGADSFLEDCAADLDCECPDIFDPVCFVTATGDITTYLNMCVAICQGVDPNAMVDCNGTDPCVCSDVFAPVCVETPSGDTLTFTNACYAECEGFGADAIVDCSTQGNPCDCPFIYDPVCVQTVIGVFEFFNACAAECEGFTPDQFVDCYDDPFGECFANFFLEVLDSTGLLIQFTDVSFSDVDSTIIGWEWSFGDGATSTDQNPIHTYAASGTYDIILTITTSTGCVATTSQHVYIGNGGAVGGPDCQAVFLFEQDANDKKTFYFTDVSLGEPTSWLWDFGDGTTSTEQNPTHTYTDHGAYLVTLTISTETCTTTMSMLLFSDEEIVYDSDCIALFVPFMVPDDLSAVFFPVLFFEAVSFEWDFGDGATSTDVIAFHEYAAPGVYEVSLTITTATGCTNTFIVTLNFEDNNFTGSPSYFRVTSTEELVAESKFRAYPNPTSDQLTLEIDNSIDEEAVISLFSVDGKAYATQQNALAKGMQTIQLDVSNLVPGIYFLRIQTERSLETIKFVKE